MAYKRSYLRLGRSFELVLRFSRVVLGSVRQRLARGCACKESGLVHLFGNYSLFSCGDILNNAPFKPAYFTHNRSNLQWTGPKPRSHTTPKFESLEAGLPFDSYNWTKQQQHQCNTRSWTTFLWYLDYFFVLSFVCSDLFLAFWCHAIHKMYRTRFSSLRKVSVFADSVSSIFFPRKSHGEVAPLE